MIAEILSYIDLSKKLPRHQHKKYTKRSLESIQAIIIHHSGIDYGDPETYAKYHVKHNDWPGIGYHMVAKDATISLTNTLDTISYHCKGHNSKNIGICHVGNFNYAPPTDLVYWTYIRMVLIIDMLVGRELPIKYHNELGATKCPGLKFNKSYFEKELKNFRYLMQ